MIYRGRVKNGVVVLDEATILPEGAEVQINVVAESPTQPLEQNEPTLYERLKPFIAKVQDLPPDLSINHDHYLYGTPKRQ